MKNLTNTELLKLTEKRAGRSRVNAIKELTIRSQQKTGKVQFTFHQVLLALDLVEPKVF